MIKIIDATLTMFDDYVITKEQIIDFINLLKMISIVDVVISQKIYEIANDSLPDNVTYYMEQVYETDIVEYNKIDWYISSFASGSGRYIKNIQMNELTELSNIDKLDRLVRFTGLDDMLIYGNDNMYNRCLENIKKNSAIFYPENTYKCATAMAVSYLEYNNNAVVMSTFAGIGNKAATEQIIIAARICKRYKPNNSFNRLSELRELYEQITGTKIVDYAPVIGRHIFYIESGIHVDGVLKKASNYESYPPELVGSQRKIILGKHSGTTSIRHKLEELGIEKKVNVNMVLERIKIRSMKKRREITDNEFTQIVDGCDAYEETY